MPSTLDPKAAAVFVGRAKEGGLIPFLLGFIPQTYVGALAERRSAAGAADLDFDRIRDCANGGVWEARARDHRNDQ